MERDRETGISILVIGAGIAGLSFAIESHRKGHNIRIVERRSSQESAGEMIIITTSALHTPKKWPGFMERARKRAIPPTLTMKRFNGDVVGNFDLGDEKNPSMAIYRSELHKVLHEYASLLGIPIDFSTSAVDYFETEDHGGVELADGRKLTADIVVAADGVGSKSWHLVGEKTAPMSSEFVLYRVTFPAAPALENPTIRKEFEGVGDRGILHAGPGAHMVTCLSGDKMCWMLTCKDDDDKGGESWSQSTSIDKALEATRGWEPFITEVIKATPGHTVLDWKLMWRDPQPRWVSPTGRIAGKNNACLATEVHNHLRFERVSSAQKMGFKNREVFHNTNWDIVTKNPEAMGKMVGDWIIYHDPEQYAYDSYTSCADHILNDAPFEHRNAVPGYTYEPWTVKQLLEASDAGQPIVDEGLWH
ncbi:unnamed protein product [Alternaria alternata]